MTSGSEDIPPQGEPRMAHMVGIDSISREQRVVYVTEAVRKNLGFTLGRKFIPTIGFWSSLFL
jgi:hypothetical protein